MFKDHKTKLIIKFKLMKIKNILKHKTFKSLFAIWGVWGMITFKARVVSRCLRLLKEGEGSKKAKKMLM